MADAVLIVGQGLAGSMLYLALQERGVPCLLVDDPQRPAASRIAPGIVHPLTGKRFRAGWGFASFWQVAQERYQALSRRWGDVLFLPLPLVRFFASQEERVQLEASPSEKQNWIRQWHVAGAWGGSFHDPWGSVEAEVSGYLRVSALVHRVRRLARAVGELELARVEAKEVQLDEGGYVWGGRRFAAVVWCEGLGGRENPCYRALPWQPAKGEILQLHSRAPLPHVIFNCGKWLQPLGNGFYRVGATYSWDPLDETPTAEGAERILEALRQWCRVEFTLVGQSAGVRPILKDHRPAMGRLQQGMFVLTGLASKGALYAPLCAELLADELTAELAGKSPPVRDATWTALRREMDLHRFGAVQSDSLSARF